MDLIEKRFNELYGRACDKGYTCYTDFLNLDEQSILVSTYLPCEKYGGYPSAERIIAAFGDSDDNMSFPIAILEISPLNRRFSDTLTHRDFLGALMNLGIKRELLGDIIVKDNVGYLFCLQQIKDYIIDNLSRLKHTTVTVREVEALPDNVITKPVSKEIIVSSLRVDAVISAVYKLSRSESVKLFSQEKIFINSRAVKNASQQLKEEDIVSVRGFGRFRYISQLRSTKKDRLVIEVAL